jgi:uncharacterized protein (DUF885 family)
MMKLCLTTSLSLFLLAQPLPGQAGADDLPQRRASLQQLIKQHWEQYLHNNPEYASIIGEARFNALSTDFSPAAVAREQAQNHLLVQRLQALEVQDMSAQEQLNRDLLLARINDDLERIRFREQEMPLLQNEGIHLLAPQVAGVLTFTSVKDYDDYLTRLHHLPRQFEQTMVQMRAGMQHGMMPPRYILDKVATQCQQLTQTPLADSPFSLPLKKMPDSISPAERSRITAAVQAAIQKQVTPAYQKLASFIKHQYAPKGRSQPGLWALPNGVAHYAWRVRRETTTAATPEQIHQLGLQEVARLEGEMQAVAKKLGAADLASFNASLKTNPELFPTSREDILQTYRAHTEQMYTKLPQLFGHLPKAKMEVRATESFREVNASGAEYNLGTPDGSRPGIVFVNTFDFAKRTRISMESTALHEGVPGHHLQGSIAQELADLPDFRRYAESTAYIEGWALYAESLGREVGAYQNPYNYYGHLQDEMLRAIRLVLDTGVHAKKWSRQQMVDFFHQHSGIDEVDVQSETDRYVSWPGQALGYKVGQLKILELRNKAKAALGDKFDVRAFHDLVLGSGALPLNVLQRQVEQWLAGQQGAASAAAHAK